MKIAYYPGCTLKTKSKNLEVPGIAAMAKLGTHGYYGAIDPAEGCVWRVERDKPTGKKGEKVRVVDFLVKYVRPDKEDGIYLPDIGPGGHAVWNWSFDKI